jgi:hypothetical protein
MDSEQDVRFRLRLAEGFLQEAEEDFTLGRIELSATMDDGALSSVDLCSSVCEWEIESRYTMCHQDIEEFQARQSSKPRRLPERQAFFHSGNRLPLPGVLPGQILLAVRAVSGVGRQGYPERLGT